MRAAATKLAADHQQAVLPATFRRFVLRRDPTTGKPHDSNNLAGQLGIAGDALGDGAGAVGLGRPDPPLARTVAELHQVVGGQADRRNAAILGGGGIHDASGVRP